jgi:putative phosphoribosyl transferase
VARALGAPLDVWVEHNVGVPGHEELRIDAVSEGEEVYLNEVMMSDMGQTDEDVAKTVAHKLVEVDQRVRRFRGGRLRLGYFGASTGPQRR